MSEWKKIGWVTIPWMPFEKKEWILIPYARESFPLITDEFFTEKLTQFADFNLKSVIPEPKSQKEIEAIAKQKCDSEIELSTYQTSIRNFLSNDTPYNGLLLFHGLGTGKTCSAITVAEEHRKFLKQSGMFIQEGTKRREKRIYILGGPNLKSNFKKQLFDSSKVHKKNGEWGCRSCLGNALLREVNPANLTLSKEELIKRIQDNLHRHYKYMGYIEFANMVQGMKTRPYEIRNEFENSMIIIDEVHNIKGDTDNDLESETDFTASKAIDLITKVTTVKLLFLSATPMFNEPSEIVWIINMLNQNDKKPLMVERDFFRDGMLLAEATDRFVHHIRGYVSYVKGENPYTFPYRIYPNFFDTRQIVMPITGIDGTAIGSLRTRVYPVELSPYQKEQYLNKIAHMKEGDVKNFTWNKTLLSKLNMCYPDSIDDLTRYMRKRSLYEYYPETIKCFDPDQIQTYSAKIYSICRQIEQSTGIVLVYSRLISDGAYPMALALESMGYTNVDGNMMSTKVTAKKYCLITGESNASANIENINRINSKENLYGDKIKVVIISAAASEGVDLHNIRQIHIMDPWWHLNRNEQIIGRGIRLCSHKALPFEERNAQIFLYVSLIGEKEAFDYHLYRYAEEKASKIGQVTRLLKENAMDCAMNHLQIQPVDVMNLSVDQIISTGEKIKYPVGDNSYSVICDFMDCTYRCRAKERPVIYPRRLFDLNRTIEKIRFQFNHGYVYTANELYRDLSLITPMTYDQLYEALTQMVDLKMECRDATQRSGYIVNYGKYYLFQPRQLPGPVPVNERRIPSNPIVHSILLDTEAPAHDTDVDELLETMHRQYQTYKENIQGTDWYSKVTDAKLHILETMRLAKRIGPSDELDPILFDQCVLEHMIELLLYNPCMDLLNDLFFKKSLTPFEENVKSYFKVHHGILRIWDNTRIVCLKVYENKWVETVCDTTSSKAHRFGTVVGGIANNNQERVFKSKSMRPVRDDTNITYGQICTQASKSKPHERIAEVLEIDASNYDDLDQKRLCCELELLLRYLNKIGPKTWFLSAVEVLEHNEQVTVENNATVVNLMKAKRVNTKK
jgi:hypothetical protein